MSENIRGSENGNLAHSTNWAFTCPEFSGLKYFCTNVPLPGITANYSEASTPYGTVYEAGSTTTFDSLSMTFLVNEDLSNWLEIFKHLRGVQPVESEQEHIDFDGHEEFDITLIYYLNSNTVGHKFFFKNARLVSLSGMDFDTTDSVNANLTATVEFVIQDMIVE